MRWCQPSPRLNDGLQKYPGERSAAHVYIQRLMAASPHDFRYALYTMKLASILLTSALVLTACGSNEPSAPIVTDEEARAGNIGVACTAHEDCITPTEFRTRSSCPFMSQCISGKCAVVCPMMEEETDEFGFNKNVSCNGAADCSCSGYVGQDMHDCTCVDNACMAVVAE